MTSMLLTLRRAPGAGEAAALRPSAKPSPSLGAVAGGDALLFGVLGGGGLDHVAHQLAVGLNPPADDFPLLAIPLLEFHGSSALVVRTGDFERLDEPGGPQLLDALLVEVEVFQPPTDLLAGEGLLSVLALRRADGLDADDAG